MTNVASLSSTSKGDDGATSRSEPTPVMMLVGDFPPECCGIGDYTAHLSAQLSRLGTPVTVLTRPDRSPQPQSPPPDVTVHRIIESWNASDLSRVLKELDRLGPGSIVHFQYGGFGMRRRPLLSLFPAYLRLHRSRCRVVLTLHEYRAYRHRARALVLPMIWASHGVVFVDPPDLDHLRRLPMVPGSKLRCIPIASNIQPVPVTESSRQQWRRELGFAEDDPVVVHFGNVEPRKGFSDLLIASRQVRDQGVPLRLLVVGGFDAENPWLERHSRDDREALRRAVLDGWAVALPRLTARRLSQCLHAADLAAFPYLQGARSNRGTLLAAIAHCLPVVTTAGEQTPAGFDREYGVSLVPARDGPALAERLRELVEQPWRRDELRKRMTVVQSRTSWEEIARRTLDFYRTLRPPTGDEAATAISASGSRT